MANWASGEESKRIGIAEMMGNICIVYVTGYHRDVPTRKFEQGRPKGAPVIIEAKDQLHADVILIDPRSGQAFEHRDQTFRSWALIKVARDLVGGDPLLGTFWSTNNQANSASWQPMTGDQRALELAGTWLDSKGEAGWVRSAPREPEVHTAPAVPAYQPAPSAYQPAPGQQGYHGWPQDATPQQPPAYQPAPQQAPPSWAQQAPQQQPPAYQPAPQPPAQPTYQQPQQQQQFTPQQPAQGYQQPQAPQGQPDQYQQWAQSQQQPRYDQRMEAYQEQRSAPPQQAPQQAPQGQTSLQQMMAAGAIAPPPVAGQQGSGYAGGPEQPPF